MGRRKAFKNKVIRGRKGRGGGRGRGAGKGEIEVCTNTQRKKIGFVGRGGAAEESNISEFYLLLHFLK